MNPPVLAPATICQVALVVRDIELRRHRFASLFGVAAPPVVETGPASETQICYRGASTPARAKLAFFDLGALQLELIEPIGGPSIWQEHLDRHGEGVHHLAFRVSNVPATRAALAERGSPTVQTGEFTGGRYAYVDATGDLGVLLELLEIDRVR